MTVKELIEILKNCDENKTVNISVERGWGTVSGSEDIGVNEDDNLVYIGGDETYSE